MFGSPLKTTTTVNGLSWNTDMYNISNRFMIQGIIAKHDSFYWMQLHEACKSRMTVACPVYPCPEYANMGPRMDLDFKTRGLLETIKQECALRRILELREEVDRKFACDGIPIPEHVQKEIDLACLEPPSIAEPSFKPLINHTGDTFCKLETIDGIYYGHVQENQFSLKGRAACTSISFVVAATMREKNSVGQIMEEVPWVSSMTLGIRLWRMWLHENPTEGGFQTLEQIRVMPAMKKTFELLGGTPEEYGGRLDGIPQYNIGGADEFAEYVSVNPGLLKTLTHLGGKNGKSACVITIGNVSLSIWCSGKVVGLQSAYVLFESHGILSPRNCSSVIACCGPEKAFEALKKISGMSSTYCMYVFE